MKTITIILACLFCTSCLTVRKIEKNCDLFTKVCVTEVQKDTVTKTVIKTEVVYRDTTIYINIPGETVIKEVPVYIKNGIADSELSILQVPYSISHAQVINSKLSHELVQTDTIVRVKLENALKVVKTQEKQIKVLREKYVVPIKENKPFAKFTIKWFFGSLLLILIGIGILFFKYKTES